MCRFISADEDIQVVAAKVGDVARRVPTPMPIARSANGAKSLRVVREGYLAKYFCIFIIA